MALPPLSGPTHPHPLCKIQVLECLLQVADGFKLLAEIAVVRVYRKHQRQMPNPFAASSELVGLELPYYTTL